ncbi:MAG: hypothetical protein AAF098_00080 [Pseudomonadota bacterium]
MQVLLNQFQLRPGTNIEELSRAWKNFANYLIEHELASRVSTVFDRLTASDFDSDEGSLHTHCSMIFFKDAKQAALAWEAIEHDLEPLAFLHREVMRLVKKPSFTFWNNEE